MSLCYSTILLFLLLPYTEAKTNDGGNHNSTNITNQFCPPTTCGEKGPKIRFPFRLKTQPVFCGLEGFELSCFNNNTLLQIPSSSSNSSHAFYVQEIFYLHSVVTIIDADETKCPLKTLLSLNVTGSKFASTAGLTTGTSLYEIQARRLQQVVCSSSCGDIKTISYPFRLKGDPAGCGDHDYELSCQSDKTILEHLSGKYLVKRISYAEQKITLVDVDLTNGSCSLPRKNLSMTEFYFDNRYHIFHGNFAYANFVRCPSKISDPTCKRLPCLDGNQSYVYVKYGGYLINDIPESCSFISKVPIHEASVEYPPYETIQKLLQSGFDLIWSAECRDCKLAGRRCHEDRSGKTYKCMKEGKRIISHFCNLVADISSPSKFSVAYHFPAAGIPVLDVLHLFTAHRANRRVSISFTSLSR
ncbi:hypothetical protein ACOSP7_019674 [Xanthoceras sorbifolium]